MRTERIRERLERRGYKVTTSMQSGKIFVTSAVGTTLAFETITEAYRYYFGRYGQR